METQYSTIGMMLIRSTPRELGNENLVWSTRCPAQNFDINAITQECEKLAFVIFGEGD